MLLAPLPNWDSDATREPVLRAAADGSWHSSQQDGPVIQKSVQDLRRYAHLIRDTQPELIIETGTRLGGSAVWFAQKFDVAVVTIDVRPDSGRPVPARGHVTYLTGDSVDARTVAKATQMAAGLRTMVVLDSDHHEPHVTAEIRRYAPLVSAGCSLVVEDTCADLWTNEYARQLGNHIPEVGGPLLALQGFAQHAHGTDWLHVGGYRFLRDVPTERMDPIGNNPCGWWLRA